MEARWDLDNNEIIAAQQNAEARESYLANHRNFILHIASNFCHRPLNWGRDDELSIALIAFNEAIAVYDPLRGVPFLAFARRVITNRLTDLLRKESRHKHLSLESTREGDEQLPSIAELKIAWDTYTKEQVDMERAEELANYRERLQEFGLSFADLVKVSPKHRDTRENLMHAAATLCAGAGLRQKLFHNKQLPLKELSLASGLNLKTLERGRKYIIAVAVILSNSEEFLHLRSYIKFPARGVS